MSCFFLQRNHSRGRQETHELYGRIPNGKSKLKTLIYFLTISLYDLLGIVYLLIVLACRQKYILTVISYFLVRSIGNFRVLATCVHTIISNTLGFSHMIFFTYPRNFFSIQRILIIYGNDLYIVVDSV